jgi:hypothetical protein
MIIGIRSWPERDIFLFIQRQYAMHLFCFHFAIKTSKKASMWTNENVSCVYCSSAQAALGIVRDALYIPMALLFRRREGVSRMWQSTLETRSHSENRPFILRFKFTRRKVSP